MKLKLTSLTEKQIEHEILFLLNVKYKIAAMKLNNIGAYDTKSKSFRRPSKWALKGVADIFAFPNMWIEVKKPGCYQSPEQKAFEQLTKNNGGIYFVVKCESDLVNNLKLYGRI